jgi:hypothetical protein
MEDGEGLGATSREDFGTANAGNEKKGEITIFAEKKLIPQEFLAF